MRRGALQVYADGYWLIYVDTELEEVTHVPLDRTPAGFLVRKTVSLSDGVRVTKVERTDHRLFIHIVQTDEPESGTVILSFDPDPLRLREWTVVDAQGIRTLVALIAPTFNAPIERKVFGFRPGEIFRRPARRLSGALRPRLAGPVRA